MNRPEAYNILSAALERHRGLGCQALSDRIGLTNSEEVVAPSGVRYTVDIAVTWSDSQRHSLVVRGRIDDQNTFQNAPMEEKIHVAKGSH